MDGNLWKYVVLKIYFVLQTKTKCAKEKWFCANARHTKFTGENDKSFAITSIFAHRLHSFYCLYTAYISQILCACEKQQEKRKQTYKAFSMVAIHVSELRSIFLQQKLNQNLLRSCTLCRKVVSDMYLRRVARTEEGIANISTECSFIRSWQIYM